MEEKLDAPGLSDVAEPDPDPEGKKSDNVALPLVTDADRGAELAHLAKDLERISQEKPKNKQPVALSARLQQTLDELRSHLRYEQGVPSGHANFSTIAGVAIEHLAREILGRETSGKNSQ